MIRHLGVLVGRKEGQEARTIFETGTNFGHLQASHPPGADNWRGERGRKGEGRQHKRQRAQGETECQWSKGGSPHQHSKKNKLIFLRELQPLATSAHRTRVRVIRTQPHRTPMGKSRHHVDTPHATALGRREIAGYTRRHGAFHGNHKDGGCLRRDTASTRRENERLGPLSLSTGTFVRWPQMDRGDNHRLKRSLLMGRRPPRLTMHTPT